MPTFTKTNSPKRQSGAAAQPGKQGAPGAKKAAFSLERKDYRYGQKGDILKKHITSSTTNFQTINSNLNNFIKHEGLGNSSTTNLSAPFRKDIQSKDRKGFNENVQYQQSRLGTRQGESTRTPGKVKKVSNINSYKKANNLQQSKQVLNQSMTSVTSSGKNANIAKYGNINAKSRTSQAKQRTGIHQREDESAEVLNQSRQLVSSPFKSKQAKGSIGQNNEHYIQYANQIAQLAVKSSKKPASSLRAQPLKAPKQSMRERSQQRDVIAHAPPPHLNFSVNREYEGQGQRSQYNSKSPSKKSLQLQQILKSINLQKSNQQQAKNRNVSHAATVAADTKNPTSHSNSMVRNPANHGGASNFHNHTKSYQYLMHPQAAQGASVPDSTLKSQQNMAGVSQAAQPRNSLMLVSSLSNRGSHANPYIQQRVKQNIIIGADSAHQLDIGEPSQQERKKSTIESVQALTDFNKKAAARKPSPVTENRREQRIDQLEEGKDPAISTDRLQHKRGNSFSNNLFIQQSRDFHSNHRKDAKAGLKSSIKQKIDVQAQNHYFNNKEAKSTANKCAKDIVTPLSPANIVGVGGGVGPTSQIGDGDLKIQSIMTERSGQYSHRRAKNERLASALAPHTNGPQTIEKTGNYADSPQKPKAREGKIGTNTQVGGQNVTGPQRTKKNAGKQYDSSTNPQSAKKSKYNNHYIRRFLQTNTDRADDQIAQTAENSRLDILDSSAVSETNKGDGSALQSKRLSENIDEVNIQQSSIKTPKRLSDMNPPRNNHGSASNKIPPRGPLENQIFPTSSNTINDSSNLPGHAARNSRKETKYMEISFSNENNSNNEGEAPKKVELPEQVHSDVQDKINLSLSKPKQNTASAKKKKNDSRPPKNGIGSLIYDNPYQDCEFRGGSDAINKDLKSSGSPQKSQKANSKPQNESFGADGKGSTGEQATAKRDQKQGQAELLFSDLAQQKAQSPNKQPGLRESEAISSAKGSNTGDEQEIPGQYRAFEDEDPVVSSTTNKSDIIKDDSARSNLFIKAKAQKSSPTKGWGGSDAPASASSLDDAYPMSPEQFLRAFKDQMLEEEIAELTAPDCAVKQIYFPGGIASRRPEDVELLRSTNDERIRTFQERRGDSASDPQNGEYQGNPVFDNFEGYYRVEIGDHLAYRYEVMKVVGKGSFAQVVQCRDHGGKGKPTFAVKITRNTEMDHKFAHKEAQYLRYIMQEDPHDKHNIVRMLDQCYFRDHHCFVFELLHTDLFEHLKATGFVGFSTEKIREYALQILKGLVFLEKHKIIHCDLKPENILCVDTMCRSLKIVDFGSGCFRDEQIYTYVQSRFYRSPEVILRIKYSEKVDIWSLGCILAELYTGEPIFPGNNEQEQLELIMELCGMPPDTMIDKSRKKDHYFDTDYSPFLIEDEELGILRIPQTRTLREAVPCEDNDFLDFVEQCLEIDPESRFSASEAMEHPWIKSALEDSQSKQGKLMNEQRRKIIKQKQTNKRMGQNESADNIYQPQIIRDKEVREREGDGAKEDPAEISPERELIAQRKKPSQKPNKESFGIKLNNLNLAGSSSGGAGNSKLTHKKHSVGYGGAAGTEIKVSDFIEEQKKARGANQVYGGDGANYAGGNDAGLLSGARDPASRSNKASIDPQFFQHHDGIAATNSSKSKGSFPKESQETPTMKNQYYSIYKQHTEHYTQGPTGKQKSIIPEIDFTNKYVVRQSDKSVYSRNEQSSQPASNKTFGNKGSVSESQQQSSGQVQSSPLRNRFTNHLSQLEQISRFENEDGESSIIDSQSAVFGQREDLGYQTNNNSSNPRPSQPASGAYSLSQSISKKRALQNNFFQPSQ